MSTNADPAAADAVPFGAMARFDGPEALLEAVEHARRAGYQRLEAFSPYPIHGLDEAIGMKRSKLPIVVFFAAATGGLSAWLLQWYLSVIEYPLIVAGKPLNSTEAFIPIIFETTILFGAFGAVFGLLAFTRLPRLHYPTFDAESFARVTADGFFLVVDSRDPKYHPTETLALLRNLGGKDETLLQK